MQIPRFHLITPVCDLSNVRALVECGVDAVQVRDKAASDRVIVRFIKSVIEKVRPLGAVVLVNDRIDLALAAEADGVHLGANELPVEVARALAAPHAPGLLVGATCRTREQVLAATAAGASYAGVGPVFASTTKRDLPDPIGAGGLAAASGSLPIIAIGGVSASTAGHLISVGGHGVAVGAAVSGDADPLAAVKSIASALVLS